MGIDIYIYMFDKEVNSNTLPYLVIWDAFSDIENDSIIIPIMMSRFMHVTNSPEQCSIYEMNVSIGNMLARPQSYYTGLTHIRRDFLLK